MKKIFYVLTLCVVALTSCQGYLDRYSSTALSDNDQLVTSVSDVKRLLNSVGLAFTTTRMAYASEFGLYADITTNEFKIVKSNGQTVQISEYNRGASDQFPGYAFTAWYTAMARANKTLEAISKLNLQDDELENIKGQLYAWRALCLFDAARLFCFIPRNTDVNKANSGMIISDQVYEPDYQPARNTLKETYDQIIKDFTTAIPLLAKDNGCGYFSKYGAVALRARAYLYMGEYQKALDDAKDVIANSGKSLYTREEYEKAWKQKDTKESLFELAIDDSYNPQRYALGYYTDYNGYAECGFNEEAYLFKYLKAHPEDIRSKMIKDQTGEAFASGAQGYYPGKYPGQEGSSKPTYVNNPKIVRIAEMYLIAAEAEYYLNNVDDAIDWINELNDARIEGYEWVEPEEVEDPIQYLIDQYKIEFFTENQIAFAYWRNKRTVTAMNGVLTVPYNDKLAIFPLPQSEINCNPNLVQNEGYGR